MQIFYSQSANGFFDSEIHLDNIPKDAVEVSNDDYQKLLIDQSAGKLIHHNAEGYPIAVDNVLSETQLLKLCKIKAKIRLLDTDWSQYPDVSLTLKNLQDFTTYRTACRELFINPVINPSFPTEPNAVWE